ncbi:unnamed protein product [Adineta ricciae]|uniref:Uncharacterized protein n=1 Tax=Adineta ricciae TaxID=249248 RepID=A0A815YEH2_ADIRI|nr:unnamed protein product [Adineta ricciae]
MIENTKSNAPVILNRLVILLRITNHGDTIVSTYGTNFQYMDPSYENQSYSIAHTESVTYDQNCSCGLNFTCLTEASFNKTNSTESKIITGLKMGCIPSESFLASTLECFYDLSCINLIHEMTNTTDIDVPIPLNVTNSRFPNNSTVNDLINELFVERWTTMMNYSLYFDQCAPKICSYSYTQQLNSIYTVNYILGLFGGLTIVFKWICPKIISLLNKLFRSQKKRTNQIQTTVFVIDVKPMNSINNHNVTVDLQSLPTISTHSFVSFLFN